MQKISWTGEEKRAADGVGVKKGKWEKGDRERDGKEKKKKHREPRRRGERQRVNSLPCWPPSLLLLWGLEDMFNILLCSSSSPLIQPQPQVPATLRLLMARDERRGAENPLIMSSVAFVAALSPLHLPRRWRVCGSVCCFGRFSSPSPSKGLVALSSYVLNAALDAHQTLESFFFSRTPSEKRKSLLLWSFQVVLKLPDNIQIINHFYLTSTGNSESEEGKEKLNALWEKTLKTLFLSVSSTFKNTVSNISTSKWWLFINQDSNSHDAILQNVFCYVLIVTYVT